MDFWDLTLRFFSLADAHVRYVVAGSMFLGGAAGGLGTFAFLQRRSLMGDALAHAALPGVGIAFLLTQSKDLMYLLLGAALTGWAGSVGVDLIRRHTKIKLDAALGIVLTAFFGLGVVLLTHIQQSGLGTQAGLDKFLFGQAAAIGKQDATVLGVVGILMLLVIALWFGKFKLITFDAGFARSMGMKVGWLQFLLTTMIVLAVTIGLQAVGVVLMAAMLITPAAAARQWTDDLRKMILLASLFGIVAGLLGAYISFLAPRFPTGPWMVVVISVVFALSVLLAPRRGIVSRMLLHLKNRRKMTRDHLVKMLFKAGQTSGNWEQMYDLSEIRQMWSFDPVELKRGIRRLVRAGLMRSEGDMYALSESGKTEGARVTRLHRLWEVYLTRYLHLPGDHVHRDAEEMEHIITPELEARLERLLGHPAYDPHQQEIPYAGREERS